MRRIGILQVWQESNSFNPGFDHWGCSVHGVASWGTLIPPFLQADNRRADQ